MQAMSDSLKPDNPIEPDRLKAFVRAVGRRAGLPAESAEMLAESLVQADMMGVHTHGTKLLAGYVRKLLAGGYRAQGVPRIMREGPSWAIVDGDSTLGQVGCTKAIHLAIQKARQSGVAYVSLQNSGHIGAAGSYATMAARAGCLGIVMGNDVPSVAAPGSRRAVLGSNPLAWAAPRPDGDPILFDISTAAVAGGKVYAALARGEPIPPHWLIGDDGRPTTDGRLYPANAALAPMAGHKGYGLAMLVEILSGVMSGGAVASEVGSWMTDPADLPSRHAAGFIVFDLNALCQDAEYLTAMRKLTQQVHQAPPANGVQGVVLPGESEWKRYHESEVIGLTLPTDVRVNLSAAADLVGLKPRIAFSPNF
jgi:ureidoglycolate dehydrogenase (NAD+)